MTGPDKIWLTDLAADCAHRRPMGGLTEYIRADLHQSALAERDREIARLTDELDILRNDPDHAYFKGMAAGQSVLPPGTYVTVDSPELAVLRDQVARLQARLDAGPSAKLLRMWAPYSMDAAVMIETANRMEAANAE